MIDEIGRILALLELNKMQLRPTVDFVETWQDVAIDAAVWTQTNPATGSAWTLQQLTWFGRGLETIPNANETARLVSDQPWDCLPNIWGANTMQQNIILEFEAKFTGVANLDNANCFFGLCPATNGDRTTADITGFYLNADALAVVSDDGGAETTNTGLATTLTDLNLFSIDVRPGITSFKVNGAEVAQHLTNQPDRPMYIMFYLDTEAGGPATFELGKVRVYWLDKIFYPI